tara:strand:+ start:6040 stop:7017 length:978 start_codon:yes stop_codon:yes gene_type:complete
MALNAQIQKDSVFVEKMRSEVGRVVVGQPQMLEGILIGLLTGGHILLEGVPGLAKTLTISTIARTIDLHFQRLQFTPDLLPSDLIGTMIYNQNTGDFQVKKGPIFANIVLADEINRAPAKVQSALLEAMAEKQVTIGENTFPLDKPFLVMATQNPLEQEGTYALPEAQMDRFMFKIIVEYPSRDDELEILNRLHEDKVHEVQKVISKQELMKAKEVVNMIFVDEKLKNYIVDLVMATRRPKDFGLGQLQDLIAFGCSPRATISMVRAAKGHAFINGRGYISVEDIKAVAYLVFRHRIGLTYEAEAEDMTSDSIISEILNTIEVPV